MFRLSLSVRRIDDGVQAQCTKQMKEEDGRV